MKTNNCENNMLCFISFGFNINHCFPSNIQLTLLTMSLYQARRVNSHADSNMWVRSIEFDSVS